MKICLINPVDSPRSEVFDLGYNLNKRGHEVTILYPTNNNKILTCQGNVETIAFHANFLPKIHYTIPSFKEEYEIISRLVIKNKYDVIQICDYDYLTSLPPIFLKRKINVPIITTTDAFVGTSWLLGNYFIDSIGLVYTKTLGKFIIDSSDKLVGLYSKLLSEANNIGIPRDKINILPNGVNLNQFNYNVDSNLKNTLGIKDNEKVLLYIGRMALVKRLDILIEITNYLIKDGWNIKTILVGDGEYKKKYKDLAKSNDKIIFIDSVPHNEIHKYHAIADIFVLPSLSEGLPTVLLESAACGKVIIATNTGGISDIVIHGETGFLVNYGDINTFIKYINIVLNDENLSKKLGANAYEHMKKNFSWDYIVDEYVKLYKDIVG